MEIISYNHFYTLKLADFISNMSDIEVLEDWEFMNAIWQGESLGFSEWLQLSDAQKEKSVSLDLNDLLDTSVSKICSTLKLPVIKGMTKDEIISVFGAPKNIESFVSDRVSFEYIIGTSEKYYLSLTVTDDEGLIYLVLMNHAQTIADLEERAGA